MIKGFELAVNSQQKKMGGYSGKLGVAPGTLNHIGSVFSEKIKLRRTVFSTDKTDISESEQWDELIAAPVPEECVVWIEVQGLHDVETIDKIGSHFAIHPLVMEDILNTTQRPKFEELDEYLYFVLRTPFAEKTPNAGLAQHQGSTRDSKHLKRHVALRFEYEQVSCLCGKNWVISFVESSRDLFAPIRDRILKGKGLLRTQGSDFLTYELLDLMVDNFFIVLEEMGDSIEFLDEALVRNPGPPLLRQIHLFKRQLLYLHKAVWPVREVIGSFERCDSKLCMPQTKPYLRDVLDHIIQVIDLVETYRDLVSGMLDIYLSSISYKLSEVMKVLTIISTLFIPLTFIAGVYGMNFEYMPELKWRYGYYMVWGLMLTMILFMLRYFRAKKWI